MTIQRGKREIIISKRKEDEENEKQQEKWKKSKTGKWMKVGEESNLHAKVEENETGERNKMKDEVMRRD